MPTVHTVIFSKDRPLQLEGTLASFFLHCRDSERAKVHVLYRSSTSRFSSQYDILKRTYPHVTFVQEENFRGQFLALLTTEKALFLVDDNIFTGDFWVADVCAALDAHPAALGFSLRLGVNTTYCYPLDKQQALPPFQPAGVAQDRKRILSYLWHRASYDFGYPLEVSSSVYRVPDLLPLLHKISFNHPNSLEGELAANAASYAPSKPQLLCFEQSVTFCNPINKVQSVAAENRAGEFFGYSSEELLEIYERGDRLDVARYSGHIPNACHQEVPLHLRNAIQSKASPRTSILVSDNPPLISVVIPCYKQGHLLAEAVQSVVEQTYPHWECTIVNDGSPDATSDTARSLIRGHAKRSIKLIEKENEGLAEARNTGIRESRGEWILPLDSDDKFGPRMMERTLEAALSDSSVNVVSTFVQCFGANSDVLLVFPYSRERLLQENVFPYASLFKRELWERFGGYSPIIPFGAEDYNFWVTCSSILNPRLIPEPHFCYRKHNQASMVDAVISHQAEVNACLHSCHPEMYEISQLLHDHEVIAAMGTDMVEVVGRNISRFPRNAPLYLWRGLSNDAHGHWRQARRDFEMAAVLSSPHDWQPWFRLTLINTEHGYHADARTCAQVTLDRAPAFPFRAKLETIVSQLEGRA